MKTIVIRYKDGRTLNVLCDDFRDGEDGWFVAIVDDVLIGMVAKDCVREWWQDMNDCAISDNVTVTFPKT